MFRFMRSDSRLSRMLHLLIHMDRHDGPLTSEAMARMLGANPVVVRRTMAGLKAEGLVASGKGHGGGWTLTRRLEAISLLDVYRALGEPTIFAMGAADDDPKCLVERAANEAVEDALQEARALLMKRFSAVTVADLAEEFERRLAGRPKTTCG
jgi:Rrf2 family protein